MISIEMQQKIAEWRRKSREGTLSLDDAREGIAFLRQERTAMAQTSKSSKKAPIDAKNLLSELGL